MTDERGTFEHADHTRPRREHGYCTDDMARLLVVTSREAEPSAVVIELARKALRFVAGAQGVRGDCSKPSRKADGRWRGAYGVEDCWGRSLWGFGTAAATARTTWCAKPPSLTSSGAPNSVRRGPGRWPLRRWARTRSSPFVQVIRSPLTCSRPLSRSSVTAPRCRSWPWPEPRLSYANAVLPDSMIAAGVALGRQILVDDGLDLLAWLLDHETNDGHLSVTPVGGGGPGDPSPAFDQQPIEVAALADACARAAAHVKDDRWSAGIDAAVAWFLGDNDAHTPMFDPDSGGGYDGLTADGPNLNQGTESTLALISTLQQGCRLDRARR